MSQADRQRDTQERQERASLHYQVIKYSLHAAMVLLAIGTIVQLSFVYARSDFAGENPAKVPALSFVQSQAGMAWYNWFNLKQVYMELGIFFMVDAVLLYTAIFFLVSIMNDLGQQNAIMYVEGSSSMEQEKRRIKVIMAYFGSSYVMRAAAGLLIGIYMLEYREFAEAYPGFFELIQSAYFVLTDVVPVFAFFRMHEEVYGGDEQQQQQVQMQVDPDAARVYQLRQEDEQHLQAVLLNIIEATEESGSSTQYSSDSLLHSGTNSLEDNFSARGSCQMY